MNKTAKILVTICIVLVFFLLFAAIVGISGHKTPGFLGLILFAAVLGAIRAIWKSKKKDDDSDSSMLQK